MVFLPQSLRQVPLLGRELRGQLSANQRASLFLFICALVVVGFFTLSTRQEYYTLPAIPALALLLGGWLGKESAAPERESRSSIISSAVLFAVVVLGSAVGTALLISSKPAAPGADLAGLLQKNPQDYDLALGHFLDLTAHRGGCQSVPPLQAQTSLRKYGAGCNDGCFISLRALGFCHLFSDPFLKAARAGDPEALPTWRRCRDRRAISSGIEFEFLSAHARSRAARAEWKSLVRFEVSGRAPSF